MKKHVVQFEIEVEDDEKIKDIKQTLKVLLECLEWETDKLILDPKPEIRIVPTPVENDFEKFKKLVPKPEPAPYVPPPSYPPQSPWKYPDSPWKYPNPPLPEGPKWYMGDNLVRKVNELKVALKECRLSG